MDCKKDCRPYPVDPAPYAPGGCGPCKPGPHPGHRPPPPPPCPPSQYIGARYVPKFADPLEWDGAKAYENLIIVTHNNESYTSRCPVPPGIDITNERYWAKTGAYNAQLEQLKEGVSDLSSQVTGFAEDNKEFREKITQFEKDNADMKNTVAKNDARVDNLAERVATAETEIDGLQATTAQHTTEIADLHAKDEDLQRQITSNDNDIAALQAKDVEQDSRLNGIDTKLKSHDATLAQNTADIAKNTKNIQDNAAAIAVNAHELADHAEQLKDHEARLTAQHKEITDNHTAIERNTSDIAGLRSDLTEDEAKIEANRDAIAHIQEKDVQQDGRLDALEKRTTTAEGRLDGLDTKTDNTNTALTAEVDRAKAAEVANGKLIAANAAELADHAEELADHEQRITALETDNTKNKQDITDIKAKNVAQDTAISGNADAIQHINDSLTGYVKTEVYTAGQAAQDAIIGDWTTDHPNQTISQCATSQETELAEHAGQIAKLETDKADKTSLKDYVLKTKYSTEVGDGDKLVKQESTTITDALLSISGQCVYNPNALATTPPKLNTLSVGFFQFQLLTVTRDNTSTVFIPAPPTPGWRGNYAMWQTMQEPAPSKLYIKGYFADDLTTPVTLEMTQLPVSLPRINYGFQIPVKNTKSGLFIPIGIASDAGYTQSYTAFYPA